MEDNDTVPLPDPGSARTPVPSPASSTSERVLDLVALLVLLSLSAGVFTLAGPAAFTAVTSVGMGLFAAWRASHPPRQ